MNKPLYKEYSEYRYLGVFYSKIKNNIEIYDLFIVDKETYLLQLSQNIKILVNLKDFIKDNYSESVNNALAEAYKRSIT